MPDPTSDTLNRIHDRKRTDMRLRVVDGSGYCVRGGVRNAASGSYPVDRSHAQCGTSSRGAMAIDEQQ